MTIIPSQQLLNEATRARDALIRALKKENTSESEFIEDYPQMREFVEGDFSFKNILIAAQSFVEMDLDLYLTRLDEGKLMTIQLIKELNK